MTPNTTLIKAAIISSVTAASFGQQQARPDKADTDSGDIRFQQVSSIAYEIIELPSIDANELNRNTNATGLNELGQVVGVSEVWGSSNVAVVWDDGQIVGQHGLITFDPPHLFGNGKGINIHGEIVGQSAAPWSGGGFQGVPFANTIANGSFDLDHTGDHHGWSWAINDSSQVAYQLNVGVFILDPVDGVREVLTSEGTRTHMAWEINNAGRAVGHVIASSGFTHAYLYDYDTDSYVDLHNGTGDRYRRSDAYGLNELGDVVGWANKNGIGTPAVMWTADGRVIELPVEDLGPGYFNSQAEHTNNRGDVVGLDLTGGPFPPIGWIAFRVKDFAPEIGRWMPAAQGAPETPNGVPGATRSISDRTPIDPIALGKKIRITELLSPADQAIWTRMHPFEINEAGQICGTGNVEGRTRGFLMTPKPRVAGDLNLDGQTTLVDMKILIANLGIRKNALPVQGDLNRDYKVDHLDTALMLGMLNKSKDSTSLSVSRKRR